MNPSSKPPLSMEQQFALRKYAQHAKHVPREELEGLFVEIIRQKMAQENLFKRLMGGMS
ncbi:MAG: photosystem I reaction center subunit XII [Spirulina sp. SIO3F2]|nr:photosystem I reaction center subunit XII [Spirulina sp. SIO3F2]